MPADGTVVYLGRKVALGYNCHDEELDHRISKAWGKFMSSKQELCGRHYSLPDRLRLCNSVVTPTILYGCGAWMMTLSRERRLRTVQRQRLRKVWGLTRRQKGDHDQDPTDTQATPTISSPSSASSVSSISSDNSCEGGRAAEYEEGWIEWQNEQRDA